MYLAFLFYALVGFAVLAGVVGLGVIVYLWRRRVTRVGGRPPLPESGKK